MARRLFFVQGFRRGQAELRGAEARHLTRVLRVEAGQVYEISDNQSLWLAEVETARQDLVVFRLLEPRNPAEPPARVTLAAALVKFDRFEWIVEKAAELGAERIVPVVAARTERGLEAAAAKRLERWRKIALESSQQARRPTLPVIEAAEPLARVIERPAEQRYFLDEAAGAPALVSLLPAMPVRGAAVALLVGPEGGWLDQERAAALAAGWQAASLSHNILRAETAAMAALAVVMNAWQACVGAPLQGARIEDPIRR
jgi:16S rRNA (uracil1498-N3)-methyltransferase